VIVRAFALEFYGMRMSSSFFFQKKKKKKEKKESFKNQIREGPI
jgi:hypothetical protein